MRWRKMPSGSVCRCHISPVLSIIDRCHACADISVSHQIRRRRTDVAIVLESRRFTSDANRVKSDPSASTNTNGASSKNVTFVAVSDCAVARPQYVSATSAKKRHRDDARGTLQAMRERRMTERGREVSANEADGRTVVYALSSLFHFFASLTSC